MKRLATTLLAAAVPLAVHAHEPRAVPTFESIGLYWKPAAEPGDEGCAVRYRASGSREWREGLPLWFDRRNRECRGSLVHLQSDTEYEVALRAGAAAKSLRVKTWGEQFPVGRTVTLPAGTIDEPLVIREGGRRDAYLVYEAHPRGTTIDVDDRHPSNVVIAAPYVIVRGLVLKGAGKDAIEIRPGAHDVVIEDNDISGWGRYRYTNSAGWKIGHDMDSGIRANCTRERGAVDRVVIQRNRIRDPRYGANSWSWGHPAGPQGITFSYCGGNHVIRWNEITSSDPQRYFNDAIGGEDNFSETGFPNADSDIHGNVVQGAWDDGIEAEGGNANVRIWGNFIDRTAVGIGTTVTHHGPLYVFRNVYHRSRKLSERPPENDDRGPMIKAGSGERYGGGRRYVFHNTTVQEMERGVGTGAGSGLSGNSRQPLTNTVSRNNIWYVWKPHWESIGQAEGGTGNDADYDLYNGRINANAGAQRHGVRGAPRFTERFQLAPGSPGVDAGVRIPNFSDGFAGRAPDMGALESGGAPLSWGIPRDKPEVVRVRQ